MDIKLYNQSGKASGTMSVADSVFAAKANNDLVYQVATTQMSNKRQILAHAKTRAEVRGGGKKPWKQKGTGNARHGSIRSPIWIGGGVAHGPSKDVNFKKKVTPTLARKALSAVLSARAAEGHLLVVDSMAIESGKVKDAVKVVSSLTKGFDGYRAGGRIMLVLTGTPDDAMTRRATDNLPYVDTYRASDLNVLVSLSYPFAIFTKEAMAIIEKAATK